MAVLLFIDPATHRGLATFAAMAITVAGLTAAYCLTLCALAERVAAKVKAHRRLARLTGAFLIGFGLRLLRH
jgi:threonine/homoserine/homoserine lactone efflux protein